jgi:hypothetical protein
MGRVVLDIVFRFWKFSLGRRCAQNQPHLNIAPDYRFCQPTFVFFGLPSPAEKLFLSKGSENPPYFHPGRPAAAIVVVGSYRTPDTPWGSV